jgi:CRP-like cAMP-binding protein
MQRDFFAFCTTLKPSELKAMGELSWVRYVAEGDALYSPGEPGNALYIVNRGVLEVVTQGSRPASKILLLYRGDLIGDIEVFADLRRSQLVRAKEASKLQCFPRANFPEMIRLVPSFFRYLCEQITARLLKERDFVGEQDDSLELRGRISHFDLMTIHQTIISSCQTGELSIKDDKGDTIGVFYFESGQPRAARFQHLTGEEAFWQLFLSDNLSGSFTFAAGEGSLIDSTQSAPIASRSDLLIAACQYRDELDALKKGMRSHLKPLRTRARELRWNGASPETLRPLAQRIWDQLAHGPRVLSELYQKCDVCELKIFQVVSELLYSDQVTFSGPSDQANPEVPLPGKADLEAGVELTQS